MALPDGIIFALPTWSGRHPDVRPARAVPSSGNPPTICPEALLSLPERSSEPVTILVVDDEDLIRHVVCRGLWAAGYRTLEARGGEDALHLLDLADHIRLVVSDVMMPDMDGRELGRRIAAKRPDLPVLYISAYDLHDVFHRGPPFEGAAFLQKPFSPEMLTSKVAELLAHKASSLGA